MRITAGLKSPLADNHLHLQDALFSEDRPDVLRRAADANIRLLACNGTSERDWPEVRQLAEAHPEIVPSFGLHPWNVRSRSAGWLDTLRTFLLQLPSGIGEIGLDALTEAADLAAQEAAFVQQLDLACELARPVSIHCVRAWGRLAELLDAHGSLPCPFLLHSYGGSVELIDRFHRWGGYFSFSGSVLRDGRRRQQEALRQVPLDRLLLETDAPDIPPPNRFAPHSRVLTGGLRRNEPANLESMTAGVAELLGLPPAELTAHLWDNSLAFWGPLSD